MEIGWEPRHLPDLQLSPVVVSQWQQSSGRSFFNCWLTAELDSVVSLVRTPHHVLLKPLKCLWRPHCSKRLMVGHHTPSMCWGVENGLPGCSFRMTCTRGKCCKALGSGGQGMEGFQKQLLNLRSALVKVWEMFPSSSFYILIGLLIPNSLSFLPGVLLSFVFFFFRFSTGTIFLEFQLVSGFLTWCESITAC